MNVKVVKKMKTEGVGWGDFVSLFRLLFSLRREGRKKQRKGRPVCLKEMKEKRKKEKSLLLLWLLLLVVGA